MMESNLSILFQGWCERVGKCGRRWAYHIGDESFREYCSVQYESKCHTRYVDEATAEHSASVNSCTALFHMV
ncbi:hypothetical protein HBI92_161750 [Parastagonospora nodorum]|nr:hypothetical protein HBI97_181000 [Parastagonospora nodorum]KAH5875168.1 hypothetical protein HBI92_161750 [Parastagonospora nodorum]